MGTLIDRVKFKVHVNPLKPHLVMATNDKGNVTSSESETMSWRDAAIVATVLTAASFFTVFLTGISYEAINGNPGLVAFNAIVFLGKEWFTLFVALAGLGKLAGSARAGAQGSGASPTLTPKTTPED